MSGNTTTSAKEHGWEGPPVLSIGGWAIVLIAVLSTIVFAATPTPRPSGRSMWTFARMHWLMYGPMVERWNKEKTPRVNMDLLSLPALERRMLGAFLSGTPSADVIEVERKVASRAFTGPLDAVGFVDLTDRLKAEGLLDGINAPSFSPWTSRGRVFGVPHDVHPVMLSYRADLVEAAGIDVSQIKTWDDFARVMKPLMADKDGDGQPDRYLLNMWDSHDEHLEVLLLQAGGGFFDDAGHVVIDSPTNAKVLATVVSWCVGPNRIAADAPDFSASGNKLKADGYVVCTLMPDWMGDIWKHEIPQAAGKVKLMPLPAWGPGVSAPDRRTSVWGGTMLGIPRTAVTNDADMEELWAFVKHLYLSDELARDLYRTGGIVTPVKAHWKDPIFDQPEPFFMGQAPGRMYINLAPDVPMRSSSPYSNFARFRVQDALVAMTDEARKSGDTQMDHLLARAAVHLKIAQQRVQDQIDRNVFLREGEH